MNIFVIGNGFDIAHDLPTTYGDFLDFFRIIKDNIANDPPARTPLNNWNKYGKNKIFTGIVDSIIEKDGSLKKSSHDELVSLISKENIWINYFLYIYQKNIIRGENWIDFESEISKVIQHVDFATSDRDHTKFSIDITTPLIELLDYDVETIEFENKKEYINLLDRHLEDFTKCLELYLCSVELFLPRSLFTKLSSRSISTINPDTALLHEHRINDGDLIPVDAILSFNYTNVFKKLYCPSLPPDRVCYIHGKLKENNIILGIDEYLPIEERNQNVQCIRFKKFFQRIFKKTDNKFDTWLTENAGHHVHIIGHSLDTTDHDILRNIINGRFIKTTIYHHDSESFAKHVTNMVLMLKQEEVVRKTNKGDIIFKDQKELIDL